MVPAFFCAGLISGISARPGGSSGAPFELADGSSVFGSSFGSFAKGFGNARTALTLASGRARGSGAVVRAGSAVVRTTCIRQSLWCCDHSFLAEAITASKSSRHQWVSFSSSHMFWTILVRVLSKKQKKHTSKHYQGTHKLTFQKQPNWLQLTTICYNCDNWRNWHSRHKWLTQMTSCTSDTLTRCTIDTNAWQQTSC